MEHRGNCHCCRMCPNCCNYVTIIATIVSIIRIIPQPKVAFRVGIHCRLRSNSIIHHGRTVFAASSSGVVSSIDHQGAFSHNKADISRAVLPLVHSTTHDGCRKATRHAWPRQDETDRPGYQQIGQSTSSCPATRGLQVQDLDEPAIIHMR